MTPRRFLGGCIAIFFVAIALVCFAAPVVRPAIDDGWGLLDDTRAWFGAGTAEGVPNVSQVSCFRRQFGSTSTSRRSGGMSDWNCTIYLGPPDERSQDEPWAGMSPEDAYQEYMRRMNEYSDSLLVRSQGEGRIERVLATNRTGTLPTLRRLSSDRFGVIWGGGELAGRWIAWALLSAVLIGIGVLSLIGARAVRRRVL